MALQQMEYNLADCRPSACLARWEKLDLGSRIWRRDPGVWRPGARPAEKICGLSDRLGWLDLPEKMIPRIAELEACARSVAAAGFSRVVVLGMGGSSLIAEVWAEVFAPGPGCPPLTVLDSTHPQAVAEVAAGPLADTLFLVASKSGGTLETLSLGDFFFTRMKALKDRPGENFIALTDPGSRLEKLAAARNFRRVFSTPAEVGGRFSALTEFGLVPAALLGLRLSVILDRAHAMASACGPGVAVGDNPALELGAFFGTQAAAGRNQLCLMLSPALRPFAAWLEQLLAESTGKKGRGLVPVIRDEDQPEIRSTDYLNDRLGVFLVLEDDDCGWLERNWETFTRLRVPAVRLKLSGREDLGAEIWRFEMATAAAAVELKVNPFDQPDVESAKIRARQAIEARREHGILPEPGGCRLETPLNGLRVSCSSHFAGAGAWPSVLALLLQAVRPGDYLGLLPYLPRFPEIVDKVAELRRQLENAGRLPVCVGFGPRYLHSTGQLHKGGANRGLFLMLAGELARDLPLPGEEFGFATLITAQYRGDFQALIDAGRRVVLIEAESLSGLELVSTVMASLGNPE